jgi:hypothetical protein
VRTQVSFVVDGPELMSPHVCDEAITSWIGSSFKVERWSVIHLNPEELQTKPFAGSKLSEKMIKNKPIRKRNHE